MYQKILVPMALDHGISDKTLAIAKSLLAPGGQIIALHVHEALQGSVAAFVDKSVVQEGVERAKQGMAEKTKGIEGLTATVVVGHSYRTIIDFAVEQAVECIVIGSHRPGLSDYLIGSTAARVVRHAHCAVHVHRSA